jgi:hypothetical protein
VACLGGDDQIKHFHDGVLLRFGEPADELDLLIEPGSGAWFGSL